MAEIVLHSLIIQAGMPALRTKMLLLQVSTRYTATIFVLIWRVLRDLDRIARLYPHTTAQHNHNPILPPKGIYRGWECYDGEYRMDLSLRVAVGEAHSNGVPNGGLTQRIKCKKKKKRIKIVPPSVWHRSGLSNGQSRVLFNSTPLSAVLTINRQSHMPSHPIRL